MFFARKMQKKNPFDEFNKVQLAKFVHKFKKHFKIYFNFILKITKKIYNKFVFVCFKTHELICICKIIKKKKQFDLDLGLGRILIQ